MLESINNNIQEKSKIHVYLVDDCSIYGQDYLNIINNYIQYFDIKYLKTNKNSGPGVGRNLGLDNSNSNYICFWDDDDEIQGNPLEYITDVDIISTRYPFAKNEYCDEKIYFSPVHGMIFNRNFLKKFNIRFPNIKWGMEDPIFRTISFMLTDKIKYYNHSYYYRNYRDNSNFGLMKIYNKSSSKTNKSLETFNYIEFLILFSLIVEYSLPNINSLIPEKLLVLFNTLFSTWLKISDNYIKDDINIRYQQDFYFIFSFYILSYGKIYDLLKLSQNDKVFYNFLIFIIRQCQIYKNDYLLFGKNINVKSEEKINDLDINIILNFFNATYPYIVNVKELFNTYNYYLYNILFYRNRNGEINE